MQPTELEHTTLSDETHAAALRQKRAPRRRRHFADAGESQVREVARRIIGDCAATARIYTPPQGINNRTFIVEAPGAQSLVVKLRPGALCARPVRNSPQWPRYTQHLLGAVPNGGIETLRPISNDLSRWGSITVPEVLLVDTTADLLPAPYFVMRKLDGEPFGWESDAPHGDAVRQLAGHLAGIHYAGRGRDRFGIYACPDQFAAREWWPRFRRAYETIFRELSVWSPSLLSLQKSILKSLKRAEQTGPPSEFPLVCIDQSPSHYLRDPFGGIAGMIDVEAHLWAPRAYELTMIEIWMADFRLFKESYSARLQWPPEMESVRPAYWLMTIMEWIYCLRTLVHDDDAADQLEARLPSLCHRFQLVDSHPRIGTETFHVR